MRRASFAALALLAVAPALSSCRKTSPRERVEQQVLKMARAAQDKDLSFLMGQVSESFKSPEGWGKQDLRNVLAGQLLRASWVRVFTHDLDLHADGEAAVRVSGKFIFARSEAQTLKELAKESVVQSYLIEGRVEREQDGQWRFVTASHRPIEPADFL